MAAKSAIGMRRNAIMDRFACLPGFVMPTQGRDPDLLHVQQLEAVMEWVERNIPNEKPQMEIANGLTMMLSQHVGEFPQTIQRSWNVETNTVEEVVIDEIQPEPTKANPAPRGKGKRK